MNAVQKEWEKMRIAYQIRYARMYKKVKENEINTDPLDPVQRRFR